MIRRGPGTRIGTFLVRTGVFMVVVAGVTCAQMRVARAQLLWDALSTKPKANMIIAYDTSVTMQIPAGCSDFSTARCHAVWNADLWNPGQAGAPWGPDPASGWPGTRLYTATGELLNTLDLFKNDFIYGGLRYDTCGPNGQYLGHQPLGYYPGDPWGLGSAEVSFVTAPDVSRPLQSYQNVHDMVNDIRGESDFGPAGPTGFLSCEHAEGTLPGGGGSGGAATGGTGLSMCLTPNCAQDHAWGGVPNMSWTKAVVLNVANGSIPGLTASWPTNWNDLITCDIPSSAYSGVYSVRYLYHDIRYYWTPSINGCQGPTQNEAQQMCAAFKFAIDDLNSFLATCASSPPSWTQNFQCDPVQFKKNECTCGGGNGTTYFDDSCICNNTQAGCGGYQAGRDDTCGQPWDFPARQEAAICGTYDAQGTYPTVPSSPSANIGQALLAQPDNVVNGSCRENVSLFFTDGAWGNAPGVALEAPAATSPAGPFPAGFQAAPFYSPVDQISNAYVFVASPNPAGYSSFDTLDMAQLLGQSKDYDAENQSALNISFVEISNRLKRGFYNTGNAATDTYGSRLAVSSMNIPGPPKGGAPAYPDETYLGRPSRVSWWQLDPNTGLRVGTSPICESDWTSRATFSGQVLTTAGLSGAPPLDIEAAIGPPLNGENWASGSPMLANVPDDGTTSRGSAFTGPVNPSKSMGFTFGNMLSVGQTQPVVVEAPRDVPGMADGNFANFELANQNRKRVLYTMAGGYLFALDGGDPTPLTPPQDIFNIGVNLASTYDDSGNKACSEIFRYLPGWVIDAIRNDPWIPTSGPINLITPQSYTSGQVVVREARVDFQNNAKDYATLLVMTEGATGPHLAALDVSEPTKPAVLAEWAMPGPGDRTSAEPTIYTFPGGPGGKPQTMVVMPGGDGGSANLYAFAVTRSGATLQSMAALPSDNYPSDAVCFDRTSTGRVTDCVVLGSSGRLVRVPVKGDGAFDTAVDLWPSYSSTLGPLMTGEKFFTHPAVYFTTDGSAAYVFGSGDVKNLGASPASVVNRLYKVVDGSATNRGVTASGACAPDANGSTLGVINLAQPGEGIVSPPIVARGVVAFTSYVPATNGCSYGAASLYGFDAQSCKDALSPANLRPAPTSAGTGIPMSPLYVRASDRILTQTASGIGISATLASGRGSGSRNRAHSLLPLYWRLATPN